VVIAVSRFIPGMRLPTYFAAGLLNTKLFRFSIYFLLAAIVWTPLLVGLSSVLGGEVIKSALLARQNVLVQLLIAGVALYVAVKLAIQMATYMTPL
jgi:membrane protein DedA with SNARE-associated domain